MSDMISRTLLSGLGLASLTKDAIQKTAESLVKKSNLSEEEGKKIVKDLHRRSAKAQKTMERTVETAINKLLKNLHLSLVHELPRGAKTGGKRTGKRAAKRVRTRGTAKSRKA